MQVQLVALEEVVDACDRLARAVLASGFQPDTVVAIARGGFVPARFLCDFLQIGKLASIRVQHYKAGAHMEAQARVTIPLSIDIDGANVLLVDDVNDSGKTLAAASSHLQGFSPASLRTAVLHEKTDTVQAADFRVIVVREWHWILYPWAVVEDVGQFISDMRPTPQNLDEIRERLDDQYGLVPSPSQLDRVLHFGKTGLALKMDR
jgi:hypoxanthine phosphoribosyltransferase